ncbi:hypothetical protein Tco_1364165 [Tanacetum coccineum]
MDLVNGSMIGNSKDFPSPCYQENLQVSQGQTKLGLWYPRESPFDLEAFSDSDYGGSNLDNFLDKDLSPGNVRNRQLWPLQQLKLNM